MEPNEILAELKRLQSSMPAVGRVQISQGYLDWYGSVKALIVAANPNKELELNVQEASFPYPALRIRAADSIRTILTIEIKRLEVMLGPQIQPVYGPGAQYDFYRNLKAILNTASSEIVLVDPYLDRESFDLYLGDLDPSVHARVLVNKNANSLKPVINVLETKHPGVLVKQSKELHDRVLFIDGRECWVIGQSIKDAADKKPTYIAPLPTDVVADKHKAYQAIWDRAEPV